MLDAFKQIPTFVWTLPLSMVLAAILHRSAAQEAETGSDGWTTLSHSGSAKFIGIIGVVLGIFLLFHAAETIRNYRTAPDGVLAACWIMLAFVMLSGYQTIFRRRLAYRRDGVMATTGRQSRFIPWAEISAFKRGFFRGPQLRLRDGTVIRVSQVLIGYQGFVRQLARRYVPGADREQARFKAGPDPNSPDYWLEP